MKYLFTVLALLASAAQATGTQDFELLDVSVVRSGGYAFINITPDQNVSDCPRKNQIRWELTTETDKALFSMALTAHTTGQKLRINLVDGDCLGDSARPNFASIIK
jgi:hypothetical protein